MAVVGACGLWGHEQFGGDDTVCYVGSGLPAAVFDAGPLAGTANEVRPIRCGEQHDYEAISLTGTSDVEAHCRSAAEAFLGGPWELSRAVLTTLGSRDPMRGETRCALAEVDGPGGRAVARTSSLRDGLRGTRPLAIACLTGEGDGGQARFTGCARSHAAEFVGTVPRDGDDGTETACRGAVARYLGLPEVVCHNDLSPKNTVYRDTGGQLLPAAFIDWDIAGPRRADPRCRARLLAIRRPRSRRRGRSGGSASRPRHRRRLRAGGSVRPD